MGPDEVAALADAVAEQERVARAAEDRIAELVAVARGRGMTWEAVAEATGTSKQLAIYRWHPNRSAPYRRGSRRATNQ